MKGVINVLGKKWNSYEVVLRSVYSIEDEKNVGTYTVFPYNFYSKTSSLNIAKWIETEMLKENAYLRKIKWRREKRINSIAHTWRLFYPSEYISCNRGSKKNGWNVWVISISGSFVILIVPKHQSICIKLTISIFKKNFKSC